MNGYAKNILEFHCPRWEELPDIGLYMDQVVSFIDSRLRAFEYSNDAKVVSSTMINNYVKQKAIIPPDKKKYSREQIARLFVICILKRCFSITEICEMTELVLNRFVNATAYNLFCDELENALHAAFLPDYAPKDYDDGSPEFATIKAVMRAFSNKIYAQNVIMSYKERLGVAEAAED